MKAIRWTGEDDHYIGPFTYARERYGRTIAVVLGSGDGDDYPGCRLRFSGLGRTLVVALPPVIKPWRRWVDTSHYEWSKGPGGYWDTGEREYGFTISEGHLSVKLGRVTNDSSTEQRWGCFLPWTQWRHVRHSLYDLNGKLVFNQPDDQKRGEGFGKYEEMRGAQEACPSLTFDFMDYDGEALTATARIEEREWRFGTGHFKWLSLFRRPKICRSLDILFSGEVGKRKGSWKGGTIGHSIDMRPSELHEAAFRRYCEENNLAFCGLSPSPAIGGGA